MAIEALNAGADFYLSKGGDARSQFAELENAIRQLIRRKEAEGAVSYNARRFRRIIENVLDIVFIMNEKGSIKYASPSVRTILGYSPRELIGTNGLSLVHTGDHPQDATMDQVRALPATGPLEFRMRAKDGRSRWFEGVMKAFPSEHGRGDVIVSAWNIDERKRLELEVQNRERTLRAVFDNSNECQFLVSVEGTIRSVNRKACERTGYTQTELIGRWVLDLVPPAYIDVAKDHLERKMDGSTVPTTYRLAVLDKQGGEHPVTVSSRLINNPGEEPFIIVSASDAPGTGPS